MPEVVTSLTRLWQDLLTEQVERSGLVSLVKSERRYSEVQDGKITDTVYGQVHGVSRGSALVLKQRCMLGVGREERRENRRQNLHN